MSFAFKSLAGTAISSTPNQGTATLTTTTAGAAGDLAVLCYAMDNQATTDGDELAVTSVISGADNTWFKAKEFTNGQSAIQAGATVGLWFCNLVKPIPAGTPIVLTIGNPPARDATALSLCYFTPSANFSGVVEATSSLAVDGAAIGSLNAVTTNISCLRIRATASESNSATAWTKTAAFDGLFAQAVTSGGGAAVNQGIRAEYDISAGTGLASQPTGGAGNVDHASIYVAFREVAAQTLSPSLYSDADSVHAPYEMSYYFLSGYVADEDVVYAAGISTSYDITDSSIFVDADIVITPDVLCSALVLEVSAVVDDDSVYDTVVIPNARSEIGIVEDEDIFYETGVATVWLISDPHDDADDFTTDTVVTNVNIIYHDVISFDEIIPPSFVANNQAVTGDIVIDDDFHGPDFATGENPVGAGGITDGDQFFVSTFGLDFILEPALFAADDAIYNTMAVDAIGQIVAAPVLMDNDIVHGPVVSVSAVSLSAPLYADNDILIPPFIGQRRNVRSGLGVIKGTTNVVTLIGQRDKAA